MTNTLKNLSVGKKLAIGFGIIVLLALMLGAVGWNAITVLSGRMDTMSKVNRVLQNVGALDLARSDYLRSTGDSEKASVLKARLKEVEDGYAVLDATMTKPVNRQILQQFKDGLTRYTEDFKTLEDSYSKSGSRQGGGARALLGTNSDAAVAVLDRLQKELDSDVNSDASTRFQRSQILARVQSQFQRARFETRGYTYSGDPANLKRAVEQVELSIAGLSTLQTAFSALDAPAAGELSAHFKGYRAALDVNQTALLNIFRATDALVATSARLLKLSNDLYDVQMQLRVVDANQAYWLLAGCIAGTLLFGVGSAWTINRQIVPALRRVVIDVELLGKGDLSERFYSARKDEIGQLQDSLARTTGSLRQLVGHINDGAAQIASSSEELSVVTDLTLKGTEDQKREIDQVATAMHEMTTSVQDVARNAVETAGAADVAVIRAEQGARAVKQTVIQIERLSEEMDHTVIAMGQLEQESGKIGNVLAVIRSVAEQTNLLALNAAIEAARAGEAGRGFAVVADEVRGLAQRTQQSTQEIHLLVQALQAGTTDVVERMNVSQGLTSSSVTMVRETGTALDDIYSGIANVQAMTQQIATAAEEQGVVAEEINRSVLNVREIADQTATASGETNKASLDLAQLGEGLQIQVQRFSR